MPKKGLWALVALAVLCSLSACGGNKSKEEKQEAAVVETPAIDVEEMVFVPAGSFIFGTNSKDSPYANPEQKLTLPAFWIDKYEVTNKQFLDFAVKNNYSGETSKDGKDWRTWATIDKMMYPVAMITWNDAETYCKSVGKRLPTEQEWEKAARGPNGNAYPWGNEWEEKRSNTIEAGLKAPVAVGEFDDVSFYGVHDMLGNVQEWTSPIFTLYKGNPKKDLNTGNGQMRAVRGLSPYHKGRKGHLWDRSGSYPNSFFGYGCRCARDATPEEIAKASQTK